MCVPTILVYGPPAWPLLLRKKIKPKKKQEKIPNSHSQFSHRIAIFRILRLFSLNYFSFLVSWLGKYLCDNAFLRRRLEWKWKESKTRNELRFSLPFFFSCSREVKTGLIVLTFFSGLAIELLSFVVFYTFTLLKCLCLCEEDLAEKVESVSYSNPFNSLNLCYIIHYISMNQRDYKRYM